MSLERKLNEKGEKLLRIIKAEQNLCWWRGWACGAAICSVLSQTGPCPWPAFIAILIAWGFAEFVWMRRPTR